MKKNKGILLSEVVSYILVFSLILLVLSSVFIMVKKHYKIIKSNQIYQNEIIKLNSVITKIIDESMNNNENLIIVEEGCLSIKGEKTGIEYLTFNNIDHFDSFYYYQGFTYSTAKLEYEIKNDYLKFIDSNKNVYILPYRGFI